MLATITPECRATILNGRYAHDRCSVLSISADGTSCVVADDSLRLDVLTVATSDLAPVDDGTQYGDAV